MECEKISANRISQKRLLSKIKNSCKPTVKSKSPNYKWAKDMNRLFLQRRHITSQYDMKWNSTSLAIRKTKLKLKKWGTTEHSLGWLYSKKTVRKKRWGETGTLVSAGGNEKWYMQPLLKTVWTLLKTFYIELPFDPPISTKKKWNIW
jgi:hypothetical protein